MRKKSIGLAEIIHFFFIKTGRQVEAAIYTTKVILLKFFNMFDINPNRNDPINEIPWTPSHSNRTENASVALLPPTQDNTVNTQMNCLKVELIGLILTFPSICFTVSQVKSLSPYCCADTLNIEYRTNYASFSHS